MSTLVKIGIAAAFTGLVIFGVKKVKEAINAFDVEVLRYGFPTLKNYVVNLPIAVRFKNPTTIGINVNNVYAEVYALKGTSFQKVAQINQPINIPAGTSDSIIYAAINLADIFGGNILTTIQTLTARTVTLRTDVTIKYGFLTLPKQSFTNTVDVPYA